MDLFVGLDLNQVALYKLFSSQKLISSLFPTFVLLSLTPKFLSFFSKLFSVDRREISFGGQTIYKSKIPTNFKDFRIEKFSPTEKFKISISNELLFKRKVIILALFPTSQSCFWPQNA